MDTPYEPNKLYVLGLNKITTKDGLKMFMERISECDVKHILWFKPKGKAIVTLNRRISGGYVVADFKVINDTFLGFLLFVACKKSVSIICRIVVIFWRFSGERG